MCRHRRSADTSYYSAAQATFDHFFGSCDRRNDYETAVKLLELASSISASQPEHVKTVIALLTRVCLMA